MNNLHLVAAFFLVFISDLSPCCADQATSLRKRSGPKLSVNWTGTELIASWKPHKRWKELNVTYHLQSCSKGCKDVDSSNWENVVCKFLPSSNEKHECELQLPKHFCGHIRLRAVKGGNLTNVDCDCSTCQCTNYSTTRRRCSNKLLKPRLNATEGMSHNVTLDLRLPEGSSVLCEHEKLTYSIAVRPIRGKRMKCNKKTMKNKRKKRRNVQNIQKVVRKSKSNCTSDEGKVTIAFGRSSFTKRKYCIAVSYVVDGASKPKESKVKYFTFRRNVDHPLGFTWTARDFNSKILWRPRTSWGSSNVSYLLESCVVDCDERNNDKWVPRQCHIQGTEDNKHCWTNLPGNFRGKVRLRAMVRMEGSPPLEECDCSSCHCSDYASSSKDVQEISTFSKPDMSKAASQAFSLNARTLLPFNSTFMCRFDRKVKYNIFIAEMDEFSKDKGTCITKPPTVNDEEKAFQSKDEEIGLTRENCENDRGSKVFEFNNLKADTQYCVFGYYSTTETIINSDRSDVGFVSIRTETDNVKTVVAVAVVVAIIIILLILGIVILLTKIWKFVKKLVYVPMPTYLTDLLEDIERHLSNANTAQTPNLTTPFWNSQENSDEIPEKREEILDDVLTHDVTMTTARVTTDESGSEKSFGGYVRKHVGRDSTGTPRSLSDDEPDPLEGEYNDKFNLGVQSSRDWSLLLQQKQALASSGSWDENQKKYRMASSGASVEGRLKQKIALIESQEEIRQKQSKPLSGLEEIQREQKIALRKSWKGDQQKQDSASNGFSEAQKKQKTASSGSLVEIQQKQRPAFSGFWAEVSQQKQDTASSCSSSDHSPVLYTKVLSFDVPQKQPPKLSPDICENAGCDVYSTQGCVKDGRLALELKTFDLCGTEACVNNNNNEVITNPQYWMK